MTLRWQVAHRRSKNRRRCDFPLFRKFCHPDSWFRAYYNHLFLVGEDGQHIILLSDILYHPILTIAFWQTVLLLIVFGALYYTAILIIDSSF